MHVFLGTKQRDSSVVSITGDVRRKHMAIFGKSGVGKTTLMRNMVFADLHNGNGLTVIDPHGSLIQDLLEVIPRERTNDVIYIEPSHPERLIGLNVLESVDRSQRSLVVSSLISILRNLWPLNWGPRSEWILEHVIYALLEQPHPVTLAAVPKLLTDTRFRRRIVANVSDPAVRAFFDFFEAQNDRLREESIAPLLNKVSKFITNPLLRSVLGQPTSSFDFRWAADNRKILLCNLSKGALGEDVSSLLGSLIVTKLSLAALSREDVPERSRVPHCLYIDEVQNFSKGMALPVILAEARKYALSLTLATQTLSQLPEDSLAAVLGNCATILSFRVSGEDAKTLVREFAASGEGPRLTDQMNDLILPVSELQNLPDYKLYARTLSEGQPQEPFLIESFAPLRAEGKKQNSAASVVRTSLGRYGRDRKAVAAQIERFLKAKAA